MNIKASLPYSKDMLQCHPPPPPPNTPHPTHSHTAGTHTHTHTHVHTHTYVMASPSGILCSAIATASFSPSFTEPMVLGE